MTHDIPLKYYDIVDEYATERIISELHYAGEVEHEILRKIKRDEARIDDIANFLNQWGNE